MLTIQNTSESFILRAGGSAFVVHRDGGLSLERDTQIILTGRLHGLGLLVDHTADSEAAGLRFSGGSVQITPAAHGWTLRAEGPARLTFDLASGLHWYGQGELVNQLYPLETMSQHEAPFMSWDNGPTGPNNLVTPLWITATGAAILAEAPGDSLVVGFNAPPADVEAPVWNLYQAAPANIRPRPAMPGASGVLAISDSANTLGLSLFIGENAVEAFRFAVRALGLPDAIPVRGMIDKPIWTTWARFKMDIDQATILRYAEEIRANGFPGGTLEIDDKWQTEYGDSALDPARFPDPAGMVRALNALGFEVTLWIVPFMAATSPNTQEAIRHGYVIQDKNGQPYPVLWWQGYGHLLDVTNDDALAWWGGKLRTLKTEIGLAGYKFDGGESCFVPADGVTHTPMPRTAFSRRWATFGATNFPYCEARTGWFNQGTPILFRHWDKASTWGLDNGLASLITTGLSLSLTGYPFALPDMIGGNEYGGEKADRELVIRWTQANALMMAMQFSLAPWEYDSETARICKQYADLFVLLAEERATMAERAVRTGDPILRPLWWIAPADPVAQVIGDQYLVGDEYLVAPVIVPGARTRDVYLPAGIWRDYWTGRTYGAGWLRDFPAGLDILPLFVREKGA